MREIIYSTAELCPHCNKDITINLWSDEPDFLEKAPSLKNAVKSEGMHQHWFRKHRVCARCGELIKVGEGGWALADKIDWPINHTYISWTHKNSLQVLDVHEACTQDSYKQTQ